MKARTFAGHRRASDQVTLSSMSPVRRGRARSATRQTASISLRRGSRKGGSFKRLPERPPARRPRSPARRWRSRRACRPARGNRSSGSNCGPSAPWLRMPWSRASFSRHLGLRRVVRRAEGDVMHRAAPIRPGRKPPASRMSTMPPIGCRPPGSGRASPRGRLARSPARRSGSRRSAPPRRAAGHAVKAADRMLRRDVAAVQAGSLSATGDADQREAHAVRILERRAPSRQSASPAPRARRPSR